MSVSTTMRWMILVGSCLTMTALIGSSTALAESTTESPQQSVFGRLTLGYRGAFNINATFQSSGAIPARSNPGPAPGGAMNRTYDDGFNLVDSSGNAGGLTSFWGYQNSAQLPGNDTLVMSSSQLSGVAASTEIDDGPQHGLGLTWDLPIRRDGPWRWGIEATFGFSDLAFQSVKNTPGDVVRISDAYALNGITPPVAPYSGTYSGPGPLIGDVPSRTTTTIPGASTVTLQNQLDASLYEMQLGPYLEIPLVRRLSVVLSGGGVLAWIDSTLESAESAVMPGGGVLEVRGQDSKSEVLFGGFVSGQVNFSVTSHLNVAAGAQYQYLPRFEQSAGGQSAKIDLSGSVFVTAGVGVTF